MKSLTPNSATRHSKAPVTSQSTAGLQTKTDEKIETTLSEKAIK